MFWMDNALFTPNLKNSQVLIWLTARLLCADKQSLFFWADCEGRKGEKCKLEDYQPAESLWVARTVLLWHDLISTLQLKHASLSCSYMRKWLMKLPANTVVASHVLGINNVGNKKTFYRPKSMKESEADGKLSLNTLNVTRWDHLKYFQHCHTLL